MENSANELYVEKRINEFLTADAEKHRLFLEAMFRRVVWGFTVLVVGAGTLLYFVFGNAVDNAINQATSAFVANEQITSQIRGEIDAEFKEVVTNIQTMAIEVTEEALSDASIEITKDQVIELTKEQIAEAISVRRVGENSPDRFFPPNQPPTVRLATFSIAGELGSN